MAHCVLGNKLLNIQFAKYHIWNNTEQERNIQPISSQGHRYAIPPMFSREINWSEGFPNMVLSTEYSEAVNARYTFQPLWVSDDTLDNTSGVVQLSIYHACMQI